MVYHRNYFSNCCILLNITFVSFIHTILSAALLVCLSCIIFVTFHFMTISHNLFILQLMDTSIISISSLPQAVLSESPGHVSFRTRGRVSLLEKELLRFRECVPSSLLDVTNLQFFHCIWEFPFSTFSFLK